MALQPVFGAGRSAALYLLIGRPTCSARLVPSGLRGAGPGQLKEVSLGEQRDCWSENGPQRHKRRSCRRLLQTLLMVLTYICRSDLYVPRATRRVDSDKRRDADFCSRKADLGRAWDGEKEADGWKGYTGAELLRRVFKGSFRSWGRGGSNVIPAERLRRNETAQSVGG